MKTTVFLSTTTILFTLGMGSVLASPITVQSGEGLSHIAKRAGCSDFNSPNRWAQIANANGASTWQRFNNQLQPGQIVQVNCNNATHEVLAEVLPEQQPIQHIDYSKEGIKQLIRNKFGANAESAIKIAQCESGLNPNAIGDKNTAHSSIGIFQIRLLAGRPSKEWLLNPENNIDYAFNMSGGGTNWKAWSCRKVL